MPLYFIALNSVRYICASTHEFDSYHSSEQLASRWKMYTSICWYLCILPVLHRQEVVDIGFNTI